MKVLIGVDPHKSANAVATLVTSIHLRVDIRVITKTKVNPVMMFQNPYRSLSRSISSDVGVHATPSVVL